MSAQPPVSQAQFDAGLATLKSQIADFGTDLLKVLGDIKAKLSQQTNTVDLTQELADIQSIGQSLTGFKSAVDEEDTEVTTPAPPTPPSTPPTTGQ